MYTSLANQRNFIWVMKKVLADLLSSHGTSSAAYGTGLLVLESICSSSVP